MLGAQQLIETVYQLVSRNDAETMRILQRRASSSPCTRIPDGMELVSNWYMRETRIRCSARIEQLPRLYKKYVGHDNNRDFYMSNLPETHEHEPACMYSEWFPQIMYNHHQTGPAGTVMFAPPFRDPFNYNFDPLDRRSSIDMVGAAMHQPLRGGGQAGRDDAHGLELFDVVERRPAHDGVLPQHDRPADRDDRQPDADDDSVRAVEAAAATPTCRARSSRRAWHFRQSIDYSMTANCAVLDFASRYRETFLYNIYRMGKNSIERGSRDTGRSTPTTDRRACRRRCAGGDGGGRGGGGGAAATSRRRRAGGRSRRRGATASSSTTLLRDPAQRDPRGYIIPSDQPDFPTATKFVNALRQDRHRRCIARRRRSPSAARAIRPARTS